VERLVVIWCPELLEEGVRGEEARRFARVVSHASEVCPWVHPVRLGVCALPARGPVRFFGGEEAVVDLLAERVGEDVSVGVADGLFAAMLAARAGLIVPPGGSADFLAPWSVATLARPDLAVTLQRLGITTLGRFAALPAPSVSDRFGADAAACHAVARGEAGELAGLRDRAVERRLRVARGEDPDRGDAPPPPVQPSFFGGTSEADRRAARAVVKVQERLGVEAVVVGRVRGGRDPAGQSVLTPWGSPGAEAGSSVGASPSVDSGGGAGAGPAPWPGRVPPPAPSDVLQVPPRAELVDAEGNAMVVSGRGLLTEPIDRLSIGGGPWEEVVAWAGPWPVTERWWAVRRRTARLQVVTADGVARLLRTERGQWWVEALYD
jgi:protein ImuB